MTKTVATIPMQENNAQYYAGQQIVSTTGGGGNNFSFPNLNTTLISNYDQFGTQVRSTGNFSVHLLDTAATVPSTANLISPALVSVSNDTNNTLLFQNALAADKFVFLQLTDVAIADNYGSYSYLSLDDVINNFLTAYVGQDKVVQTVKRSDVLFHARRAMQELSYDTLPSAKSMELTISPNLTVPIPQDYVNYVRLAWSDANGVLHTIYPLNGLSGNPTELPAQDSQGVPTQDAFSNNLQAAQSLIEEKWAAANNKDLSGNYDPYNNNGVYDYVWWKQAYGQRYGLQPSTSQTNGYFSINQRLGTFSFSSNLKNKIIELSYISDGLSVNLNSIVPKLIEDAMYSKIMSNIVQPRRDVDGGTKQFYKRDAYVKTRNAKIRLQNLKLDEIVQVFRNQAKWIKH